LSTFSRGIFPSPTYSLEQLDQSFFLHQYFD
jgi:hypothetical protein